MVGSASQIVCLNEFNAEKQSGRGAGVEMCIGWSSVEKRIGTDFLRRPFLPRKSLLLCHSATLR